YFCDKATDVFRSEKIPVNDEVTGVVDRRPYGVVAAIKPWNFPVNLPTWTLGPALLAGNSVIFKPSELTPITGRKVVECFPTELSEKNILNLVQGSGRVGRTLVDSESVDYVSFIGSRQTGEWIYRASAEHFHGLSLELGGKDPLVVLDDADLDRVVDDLIYGAFKNCGQVCCGIERCLVPADFLDEVFERVSSRVQELTVAEGSDESADLGPMIRETEVKRVEEHLRDAEEKGAEITYCRNLPDREHGFWQAPAVLKNANSDMKIMNEETFGPVLPIRSYDNEDHAIELANRLDYGLSACVYSEKPGHARRVASRLEAGSIGINQIVGSIVELPWGGVKKSGVGRMLDREGMLSFTQSVTERWNPDELDDLDR
ncbi:MAG: aldehyde dehydrogenase, partial [bacterium]